MRRRLPVRADDGRGLGSSGPCRPPDRGGAGDPRHGRAARPGADRGAVRRHDMTAPPLARRLLAELLGSAFLAAVVIGSGIAASQLSPGNVGLQLLENALATAAGLFTIILMFGPVSGGHFNPVVSLVDASFGGLRWRDALAYIPA